jgi:hypothetical protein
MLPWWHFAISLLISYTIVASLNLDVGTGIAWIVVGCITGTLIDIDHVLYAFLVFKGRAWKVIHKGVVDPKGLLREFESKGKLHYHARRRMIVHTLTMLGTYLLSLNLFPSYSLVIGVSYLAHLVLDIEPRWLKY